MFYEKLQVVEEQVLIERVGVEVFLQDKFRIGNISKVFDVELDILDKDETNDVNVS